MAIIRLLDARRGLYRKCEELFGDAKIAEAIYRFLCDGIDDCEDVAHERKRGKWIVDEDGNIECSVCGHHGVGDLYCERCGAKMDEKERGWKK